MHQDLLKLFALQQLDSTIRSHELKQKALPEALEAKSRGFDDKQRACAAIKAEVAQIEREARALYATVEQERDKVRKWEARLGDIRNQREFQALQRETEGQRRQNRSSEERLQELNKRQEELQAEVQSQSDVLSTEGAALDTERKQIDGQIAAAEKELKALRQQRSELTHNLPPPLLRKYDAIRARRAGIGLSVIDGGCCVSCHMRLPPQLYNILQRGETIEQCPSCNRLMVWSQMLPEDGGKAAKSRASDSAQAAAAP